MRRWSVFFLFFVSMIAYADNHNCFTIVVGCNATEDGSVLIAHNQGNAGKRFFVNVHKIPAVNQKGNIQVNLKHGAFLLLPRRTVACLWLQVPGTEFGDTYMNEKGVVITSNSCPSKEDQAELFEGGIGFLLRRFVAQQASTAREAVKWAGRLIDRFGYYASGRTYCIADKKEAWVLHVIKGKHWLAQRIPDDHAAVIANNYTMTEIDLKNKDFFLGSADIVAYAVKRGWFDPQKDGKFNFAKAYASPLTEKSGTNSRLRRWRGMNLLSRNEYPLNEELPFSFRPKRHVEIRDLFKILRDHFETTEYDLSNDYKKGSPNRTKNRPICNQSIRYSFVTSLSESLPAEIGYVAWLAFARPDSNAYSPWYLSIISTPSGYTRGDSKTALSTHFNQPVTYFQFHPGYAYWYYASLSDLVDKDYRKRIKKVGKEWGNFEAYTLRSLRKKIKEFSYLLEQNQTIALKIISNYLHNIELRKWFLTQEFISDFKQRQAEEE